MRQAAFRCPQKEHCVAVGLTMANVARKPQAAPLDRLALVAYKLFPAENTALCPIDWEAWNTAIDFVANQSTKLKLVKEVQHRERDKELLDSPSEISRRYYR
jgi:hypothetical protein